MDMWTREVMLGSTWEVSDAVAIVGTMVSQATHLHRRTLCLLSRRLGSGRRRLTANTLQKTYAAFSLSIFFC
jgi:hypothetical protein